jgi:ferredoxin-thioredoxin reductase catalytic chain
MNQRFLTHTFRLLVLLVSLIAAATAFSPTWTSFSTSSSTTGSTISSSTTGSRNSPWRASSYRTRTFARNQIVRFDKNEDMSAEDRQIAMDKATKAMTAFTNKYLQNTGTTLCTDKSVPAVVIKGLAEHKVTLGAPLCPCRFYEDKEAEAKDGYWNCPCVPMRERHECHCMLFLTEDNAFSGSEQVRG